MTLRFIVLAVFSASLLCEGQASSTISLSNGVQFEISANLGRPTGQEMLTVDMARASGNSFYRIFRDQNRLAIFAYELAIELAPGSDTIRAAARPATTDFAQRFPYADSGKPTPTLSSEQGFDPLAAGQSAAIGLFEIPGMGLQVRDTIQVLARQSGEAAGPLRLSGLRVFIGGKTAAGPSPGTVAGRFVMFYIPGRGGYFFTIEPAGGEFVKGGSADGTRMQFTVNNELYECLASAPIVTGAPGADLWVYHDPAYRPSGNWTRDPARPQEDSFYTAAADSLGWWIQ